MWLDSLNGDVDVALKLVLGPRKEDTDKMAVSLRERGRKPAKSPPTVVWDGEGKVPEGKLARWRRRV
jgi:hypothetical protein